MYFVSSYPAATLLSLWRRAQLTVRFNAGRPCDLSTCIVARSCYSESHMSMHQCIQLLWLQSGSQIFPHKNIKRQIGSVCRYEAKKPSYAGHSSSSLQWVDQPAWCGWIWGIIWISDGLFLPDVAVRRKEEADDKNCPRGRAYLFAVLPVLNYGNVKQTESTFYLNLWWSIVQCESH